MSIPVDSGSRGFVAPYANEPALNDPPAEQPATSPPANKPTFLEQGHYALSYVARGPALLGPDGPRPIDPTITRNTDRALGELKKAQQEKVAADESGNPRHIDEAQMSLKEAQDDVKLAVQTEGAPSVLARHPNDPGTKTAVRAAELAIAQEDLARVEAKIPNLHDIPPRALQSRVQPPELYRELEAAQKEVGARTDALKGALNEQVLSMRAAGTSREDAVAQLRARGYGPVIGNAEEEVANGKMPSTFGMTEKERSDLYLPNFQNNASQDAKDAFNGGHAVIFAIRHDTPLQTNNERGAYDDRYVVLQKRPDGTVRVQEFDASQDPNTQYGVGKRDTHAVPWSQRPREFGPYADGGSTRAPFPAALVEAYSRVADGTIELTTGPRPDHLYPRNGDYYIEGDLNGDGVFNDGYSRRAGTNAFQLHPGKGDYSHTGSAGCLTLPPHQWESFKQAAGVLDGRPASSIYYVQVGENKMRY